MKPKIKTAFKFIIVFALLAFLAEKGLLSIEKTSEALSNWEVMAQAFLACSFTTLLAIVRWKILLEAQQIKLPTSRVFELAFIGNFFNIAIPGAVSGDIVKAIYIAQEVPGKRAQALSSILFDRIAGVSGLVILSFGAMLIAWSNSEIESLPAVIQTIILVLGLGVIGFYSYLFYLPETKDPLFRLMSRYSEKFKIIGSLLRIYDGIRVYGSNKKAVARSLIISFSIFLLLVLAFTFISKAMNITEISTLSHFIIIPIGILLTAVPILPAGIGTGHLAFAYLFHQYGSARGGDVFTIFVLYQFILGIIGGIIYLRFKKVSDIDLQSPAH